MQKILCDSTVQSPKFDNIFVQLGKYEILGIWVSHHLLILSFHFSIFYEGWFHVELSYYKAVGKFICESGMPYILVKNGLLAAGSLSGFLEGKNYNRCKMIHELTVIALQTLHFEAFLKSLNGEVTKEEIAGFLCSINCVDGNQSTFFSSIPIEIDELFHKYERYCGLTLLGEHGPTAKYWMLCPETTILKTCPEKLISVGFARTPSN